MTQPSQAQDLRTALEPDHEFKSHPIVYWPSASGEKTFEFRKDDRGGYNVGQTVRLRCYDPDHGYYGHPPLDRRITNILRGGEFGLQEGYCVLSLAPLTPAQAPDKAGEREGLEAAQAAFEKHYGKGFDLMRDCWSGGYAHDGVDAMWKGWRECWRSLAPQPNGTEASRGERLGRFGHHPDPANDFCVEVEVIEGLAYDESVGAKVGGDLSERIARAMTFRVGGDEIAVRAKATLRKIEAARAAIPTPPLSPDSRGPAGDVISAARALMADLDRVLVFSRDDRVINATNASVKKLRSSLAALTPSAPIAAPVREWRHEWCQPGDQPKRHWLVKFEDTEKGDAVFTDEAEAREFFDRADGGGWNCWLFAAVPRSAPMRDDGALPASLIEPLRELMSGYYSLETMLAHMDADVPDNQPVKVKAGNRTHEIALYSDFRNLALALASLPAPAGDVPGEAQTQRGGAVKLPMKWRGSPAFGKAMAVPTP
jgi:hypothetical protein